MAQCLWPNCSATAIICLLHPLDGSVDCGFLSCLEGTLQVSHMSHQDKIEPKQQLCSCEAVHFFPQVQKHLSKLFDNMAKLKFETDAGGKLTKTGLGMFSKEDEYVQFNLPCDCTGQVQPASALFTHNAPQMIMRAIRGVCLQRQRLFVFLFCSIP